MEIISMNLVKTAIFFLILLYASIKDIKTREVPDYIPIMICITALIENSVQNIPYMIIGAILISIPQIVIAARNPGTYGGADIKIVAACTFYLSIVGGAFVLLLGLFLSLLYNLISYNINNMIKSKSDPMVPLYTLGCIILFIL